MAVCGLSCGTSYAIISDLPYHLANNSSKDQETRIQKEIILVSRLGIRDYTNALLRPRIDGGVADDATSRGVDGPWLGCTAMRHERKHSETGKACRILG